jgi:hypothetical protein
MTGRPSIHDLADVTDHFEFIDETLVHVDAPLEGVVRAKSGELYAFRVVTLVDGCLWHWILLPVDSAAADVRSTFDAARTAVPDRWLSIIEDRRGPASRVSIAAMSGDVHRIPRVVLDA